MSLTLPCIVDQLDWRFRNSSRFETRFRRDRSSSRQDVTDQTRTSWYRNFSRFEFIFGRKWRRRGRWSRCRRFGWIGEYGRSERLPHRFGQSNAQDFIRNWVRRCLSLPLLIFCSTDSRCLAGTSNERELFFNPSSRRIQSMLQGGSQRLGWRMLRENKLQRERLSLKVAINVQRTRMSGFALVN